MAARGFTEAEWAQTLSNAIRLDGMIAGHKAVMDTYDPQKRVALYVDEWGTWYDAAPGKDMGVLYQQNSLRDAMVAALTLNIFHKHTDRVKLAAIAQTVNVLQAMILTDADKMVLTPTYHVFDMYKPFQGATPFALAINAPSYSSGNASLPMVSVTAARGKDGKLWLALANVDPHRAAHIETGLKGTATGRILSGPMMDTHNSFDQPDSITPHPFTTGTKGKMLTLDLPAKSVVVVSVK